MWPLYLVTAASRGERHNSSLLNPSTAITIGVSVPLWQEGQQHILYPPDSYPFLFGFTPFSLKVGNTGNSACNQNAWWPIDSIVWIVNFQSDFISETAAVAWKVSPVSAPIATPGHTPMALLMAVAMMFEMSLGWAQPSPARDGNERGATVNDDSSLSQPALLSASVSPIADVQIWLGLKKSKDVTKSYRISRARAVTNFRIILFVLLSLCDPFVWHICSLIFQMILLGTLFTINYSWGTDIQFEITEGTLWDCHK